METKEFERFVASQQEEDGNTPADWAPAMVDEWLKDLDSLYQKIRDFLREYVQAGSISYNFTEIELSEPELGAYSAKRMDIRIGRQHVSLVPIGTLLIGFKGRVDVEGSAGRAQLVLVDESVKRAADLVKVTVDTKGRTVSAPPATKPISWVWKIVTNTVPKTFVDLDKERFFDLLAEIANA